LQHFLMSLKLMNDFSTVMADMDAESTTPLLGEKMDIPLPTFTFARRDRRGRRFPQAIAHRGYKAIHPENTMGAFKGAAEVGAHAIETDLHLSKDGVVVLSHDANLKRCFGKEDKIIDCDWSYLETLRTLKEPHEQMPRFKDLLEYLASPGLEDIWLILDIKLDNNADDIMRLIASTIAEVKPSTPWENRVLLGCWAASYLPLCAKYLAGFPITHIGFSLVYARQFLKVPNVSFNMLQKIMMGPFGKRFLKDARKAKRPVFVWTVNEEAEMLWSIQKDLDGVLTDDPKKYLEVCDNYDETATSPKIPLSTYANLIWINILVVLFSLLFRYRYGFKVDMVKLRKGIES